MNAKFVEGNVAWFLSFGVLLYQWVLLRVNFFRSPFLIHHLLPAYTVGKFPYNRRKREKKNCMCPILIGNSVVMMIITTSKYGGSRFQYTDNLKGGVDYLYHYQALHITNHSHPSAIQSRAPICLSVVPPLGMSAWLLYVLSSPPPPSAVNFCSSAAKQRIKHGTPRRCFWTFLSLLQSTVPRKAIPSGCGEWVQE